MPARVVDIFATGSGQGHAKARKKKTTCGGGWPTSNDDVQKESRTAFSQDKVPKMGPRRVMLKAAP